MNIIKDEIVKAMKAHNIHTTDKIAVFPYGQCGRQVYEYLKEEGFEPERIDNYQSGCKTLEEFVKDGSEYKVLLCTISAAVKKECMEKLGQAEIEYINLNLQSDFFDWDCEKMHIEKCSEKQRVFLFEQTQSVWHKLGCEEPYWSVITHEEYKMKNITRESLKRFYESGRSSCDTIINTLLRNDVIKNREDAKDLSITEIGCGTGRVTSHLAEAFSKVWAYDVSKGNISLAQQNVDKENIVYTLVTEVEQYKQLKKTDIAYSYIVLQHNCPPIMEYILEEMFYAVKDDGICMFQIPTYDKNYSFVYEDYIQNCGKGMEMHVLPQKTIFEIAHKKGFIPMEVYECDATGRRDFSMMFVFKKIGDKIA